MLLKWIDSGLQPDLDPQWRSRLAEHVLESEKEARRRKKIAEAMEKDREAHKLQREESWSRPVGETALEEFWGYFARMGRPTKEQGERMKKNQQRFLELRGPKPEAREAEEPAAKRSKAATPEPERTRKSTRHNVRAETQNTRENAREKTREKACEKARGTVRERSRVMAPRKQSHEERRVFIFDIEDSFVYLDCFLKDEREGVAVSAAAKAAAKQLDEMITEVASAMYHYGELRPFEQPHVDHLARHDDGQALDGHRLARDRLATRDPAVRPDERDCLVERAHRSRLMKLRYAERNLGQQFGERFVAALDENLQLLDDNTQRLNSLAASLFAVLAAQPNTELVLIGPRSLPRLFALCSAMKLDRFFGADRIYSSLGVGKAWCLEDVRARLGAAGRFVVCGGHKRIERAAGDAGWAFFPVRSRTDMTRFAVHYGLIPDPGVPRRRP